MTGLVTYEPWHLPSHYPTSGESAELFAQLTAGWLRPYRAVRITPLQHTAFQRKAERVGPYFKRRRCTRKTGRAGKQSSTTRSTS